MCGRYAFYSDQNFSSHYRLSQEALNFRPNYNTSPGTSSPIVYADQKTTLALMHWGLIPSWAKDPKIAFKTINARAEDLEIRTSYRNLLDKKRCLVPANGFYEWHKTSSQKLPYYFFLKDQPLFSFAGLYDTWADPSGHLIYSYTIITTTPNGLVAPVHNRMPVIISPQDEDLWLDPSASFKNKASGLLRPYPEKLMDRYPVSPAVNSTRSNTPDLIQPLASLL